MATPLREVTPQSDAMWRVRVDLAAVHRLMSYFGWDDNIFNHLTHVVPGRNDQFLVKAHGLLMSEVTASNLIVSDADGNIVEGDGTIERSALHIHAAIHLDNENAACILHVHPPYGTWLASIEDNRLKMTNQNAARLIDRVAYDDVYNVGAVERGEGDRIGGAFGDKRVAIHANHGVTVIGPSVAEAFYDLYYLEQVCKEYYLLHSSGAKPRVFSDEIAPYRVRSTRTGRSTWISRSRPGSGFSTGNSPTTRSRRPGARGTG
jgi:ribulose-5-phosphate 4-epimerase/fuculose-1-phosphate aldolase